jgi:hypothetical protein
MLARASSDAGTRLRRSKSTSTSHRHAPPLVEPLDPNVAQQHALAAATAAFARSQVQELIGHSTKHTSELSRSKSTASRKSLKAQGSHFPPREMGLRSVPSQKSGQTTSTHRLSQAPTTITERLLPFDPMPLSDRPLLSARPLSAQASVTFNDYGRPSSQPKSYRQSAASSITSQQIRKARSMYYASSVQTGSPIARPPAKYLATPPQHSVSPALSVAQTTHVSSRSTVPSPLAIPRIPVAVAPDETIDKARDKYMQDFHQRSIKHKPSLFLAPFRKRQNNSKDKGKRVVSSVTTIPSTCYQGADSSAADITVSDFMPQLDTKERRSISGSLKRKIRRVFRRASNKSPRLPVQQIEASRDHFGTIEIPLPHMNEDVEIPWPDEGLLQRVRSRTPSLDGNRPRPVGSGSRSSSNGSACSNRSLHSEANNTHVSTSRVTSWGTSASGETLTQCAIKRLTVIHEAKDSIGSITDRTALASTKRNLVSVPALSAFRDPMQMESLAEEASTPPIDPKRVFSALMREINASKSAENPIDLVDRTPGAESDVFESSKTKGLHFTSRELHSRASRDFVPRTSSDQRSSVNRPASVAAHSVQSKKNSIWALGRAIKSTIRTVTPGEQRSVPCPDQPFKAEEDANTPSSNTSSRSQGDNESHTAIFWGLRASKKYVLTIPSGPVKSHNANSKLTKIRSGSATKDSSVETYAPTVEQIEMRVAKAKSRWQAPLEENATPQSPHETDRLYTVANFAQRLYPNEVDLSYRLPVSPRSPTTQISKPLQTPLSPSVYSRNTDGMSILPNESVISFNSPYEHERAYDGGSAVILTSQSVRSYVIGTPSPNRPSLSRSSRDWKSWLSHEVSGIETTSQENLEIHEPYATPSGRHRGDLIQPTRTTHTGSDDTTVIVRESFEALTPRAKIEKPAMAGTPVAAQQAHKVVRSEEPSCRVNELTPKVEGLRFTPNTFEHIPQIPTSASTEIDREHEVPAQPILTPLIQRDHVISTPNKSPSDLQPSLETPKSARMNDRFPFLNTGRRSSSNTSKLSRHSRSPTDSVGSSLRSPTTTPRQKVYSDISVPAISSTSQQVPNTAVKKIEVQQKSKENITPPSMGGHKGLHVSPLGLVSRPKSLQPLSSVALNRSSTSIAQYRATVADVSVLNHNLSSVAATSPVSRPRLRAIVRPLSPEKLSRRPRSAFDLRNTPSPRPAAELRRPMLHLKTSSCSMSRNESDNGLETCSDSVVSTDEREGSVTPGQRMAERFLKERASATVLERGARKSAGKLIREDTPAFL